MTSSTDSWRLPNPCRPLDRRDRVACTGVAKLVGMLSMGFFALASGPIGAEVALEVDADSARIWRGREAPERVRLSPDLVARTAVAAEGGVIITGDDQGSGDLFFLHHRAGSTTELPRPASLRGPLRTGPTLLALGDRLEGAAWLEGSGQNDFSIRAAAWNGSSWEDTEIISAPTGRAQLALSSTVLADGSWLVVWAGFDGEDDEIFWSVRRDGAWSRARRLHANNGVPDVLPTVASQGELAQAAWSTFDGSDYRIQTARWNGSGWDLGEMLNARGADRAGLEQLEGRSFLTFRSVAPDGWNLVELERDGVTLWDTEAPPHAERPLVSLHDNGAPGLSWPWRAERPRR